MKTNFSALLSNSSPLFRQVLVASGPLISTLSLGMTSGYSAVLLPQLQANASDSSWIASLAALPMAFGCLLGGFLMEVFGRKSTQLLTTIPCLVGWTLMAFASNMPMMLAGRFLTGLCGGLLGPSTGVYISETSEPKYRGFLLGAISLFLAVGLMVVHALGTVLTWKATATICCFFPILSLVLLVIVPESPSWLASHGKSDEARVAFFWCRGESEETSKEIESIIHDQGNKDTKSVDMLLDGRFWKPLVVIVVFIVTNQWAGVNALTFYTISILRTTLEGGFNEYLAMLIVDLIRVIMSGVACLVMRRYKRRTLAVLSGFGTFASLLVLSIYTYFQSMLQSSYFTIIPMTALVAYISFITVGFVPLPWAMMGEVFPLKYRNIGSSVSSFMGFAAFFSVVKTSPAMFDHMGSCATFMVYGTVALVGTIFVWFFLPETKDKPLVEIQEQFSRKVEKLQKC